MTSRMEAEQQRLAHAQQQRDCPDPEVHHRIKNNLQGVISLLRQHITENPGLRHVVERVIAQVRSMAVVMVCRAVSMSRSCACATCSLPSAEWRVIS